LVFGGLEAISRSLIDGRFLPRFPIDDAVAAAIIWKLQISNAFGSFHLDGDAEHLNHFSGAITDDMTTDRAKRLILSSRARRLRCPHVRQEFRYFALEAA
jgi:hypothetical protein